MRCPRAPRPRRSLLLSLLLLLSIAAPVSAQHGPETGNAPPPPPGDGELTVQIVHDTNPSEARGLSIALYALAPDGTPGLARGETDADGRFIFRGISNDPAIIYLIGARYRDIPFGERVTFAAGELEASATIQIAEPSDEVVGVRVEELRARVDWAGDRLVVREILRLSNAGQRVIQLSDGERAIAERRLPAGAVDFGPGQASVGEGLRLEQDTVRFFGPLYPGEQRVEYQYSLPLPAAGEPMRLPVELREAAGRLVIVAGTAGIAASGAGLVASNELSSESGQPLSSWARPRLAAGERVEVALTLPESRLEASLLSIPRGDLWLEIDDTRLTATVDLKLEVEPGAPVSGTPDAPLLHVTLPSGASLNGVAAEAETLGLAPTGDGGFDVLGPVGPGTTSLGYSYRMAARPEGVMLDLRFPREVETLNVLIADTGLALESSRLHRRRPFRQGTRNYLHREAFNVSPDETVDLSLVPLQATGLPQTASIALTIAAAAGAALFLMAPLRRATARPVAVDPELERIRAERETVYVAIRDLDHDHETGKLEDDDHASMREELRAEAIELLRRERAEAAGRAAAPAEIATPPAATTAAAAPHDVSRVPATEARPTRFCPHCGEGVKPAWSFCSYCGGKLEAPEEAAG